MTEPNTNGQLPPFDTDAEAGALACVLLAADPAKAAQMLSEIDLDYFYDLRHREIFQTLCALKASAKPLTNVELYQLVKDQGNIEKVGGLKYLSTLPDCSPSAENFESYLDTVRDRNLRRSILRDSAQVCQLANDYSIPSTTIGDVYSRMHKALPHKNGMPDMIDAATFLTQSFTKPDELIHGILHRGSKLVLGGGSKSFKTWNLLDLALCVSHGLPWLNLDTTPGRVLYVNFEIQTWSWQHRLRAIADAHQIPINPTRLTLWNLRGKAADFNMLLPKIKEAVSDRFALIILDPIYKLYGGADENKAGDIALLLNAIEDLAVETTAAVAFGAHFSKGNQAAKDSIDRISGSGVFARDPDSLLVFTKHETEDAFTVEPTLRNFPPTTPFVVRWNYPLMSRDDDLDPTLLKKPGGRPKTHSTESLLTVLGTQNLTTSEWQKQCKTEMGIGSGTFYRILPELPKLKLVLKSTITGLWSRLNTTELPKLP